MRRILFRFLLPFAISIGGLALLYARVDWDSFSTGFKGINAEWYILMLPATLFASVLRGVRWGVLAQWKSPGLAPVKAVFISRAGNNLLPLRAGDLIRIQYAKDMGAIPYGTSTGAVFLELLMDLGMLSVMGLCFVFITGLFPVIAITGGIILAVILGGLLLLRSLKATQQGKGRISSFIVRFLKRLHGLTFSRSIVRGTLLSVPMWGFTLIATYAGFRLLLPDVSLIGVIGAVVLIFFSAAIPSAPGFIGTYHAAVAASIVLMGFRFEDYSALPVLLHMTQFIIQTVIGLVFGFHYIFKKDWSSLRKEIRDSRHVNTGGGSGL